MNPRALLMLGALTTAAGLLVGGTHSGVIGSPIVLIGWIFLTFGLHRFGRESPG